MSIKDAWTLLLNWKLCIIKLLKTLTKNTNIIVATVGGAILFVFSFYYILLNEFEINAFQNKQFYRRHHNSIFEIMQFWKAVQFVFTELNIRHTDNIDEADIYWHYLMPCSTLYFNETLKDLARTNYKFVTLFGIVEGCGLIGEKQFVWNVTEKAYGRNIAKTMIPETFRLDQAEDMKFFEQNYQNDTMYILKNTRHNQMGLNLSSNYDYIMNEALNDGYVLAQEYMENPYLLNGRKITLRIYSVIKCNGNEAEGYLYNHGKCYYTNKQFDLNSDDKESHFTQLNQDDKEYSRLYESLPVDTNGYKQLIGITEYNYVNDQIFDISKAVFGASKHLFCGSEEFKDYNRVHLFGADFIFDENLNVKLLEINTNPWFSEAPHFDEKSKQVYDDLQRNLFRNYLNLAGDKDAFGKNEYEFRSLN